MVSAPRPETLPSRPRDFPVTTVTQLIETKTSENANKTFLVENETGNELTYGEVGQRAEEVAAGLADLGIEKGDRVATFMPNCIDHVLLWFGCMKAGAVWASLNTDLEEEDLRAPIDDIEASAIVVDESCLDQYEAVRHDVDIDHEFVRGAALDGGRPLGELFEADGEPPSPAVAPGDPAEIIFTGGTTGTPKPILLPQFAVLGGAIRYKNHFDATPEDKHLTVLQLFHSGGQQFGILGPMYSDMTTVIVKKFSASRFFDQVNEHGATIVDPLGGIWGALVKTHEEPVENTARIAIGTMNPEFVRPIWERFGIDILEAWALTENGGILLLSNLFDEADAEYMDANRDKPVGNVEECEWAVFEILDDDGDPKETGEVGEICLRPTIPHSFMDRYFGHPDKTVEAWDGLWLHTGDLGRIDEDGTLYFAGRQAHYLRRMGENISAMEIEQVIERHPSVEEAIIVGVPSEIGEEDIKAYVIADGAVDPGEVVEWCDGRIADFKLPRYVEFVDSFPRSETKNNVLRHEVRERGIGDAWDRTEDRV